MLEKDIEKRLGKEVKKLGCLYYKFVSPGNSGEGIFGDKTRACQGIHKQIYSHA